MKNHVMTFLPLVLTTFLSVSASASHPRSRAAHEGLAKRIAGEVNILGNLRLFTGTRWTFYDAGIGACGGMNQDKDYIVALNGIQFGMGYPGPQCFKKITMEYNGKKATATIVDMCPECPYGALDLSRGLFIHFAPEDQGVIYGQWHFGEEDGIPRRGGDRDGETSPPAPSTKTKTKPTPTRAKVHVSSSVPPPSSGRKLPGVAHPADQTRLSRPLNHSEKQPPGSSEMDAILPPSANLPSGVAARPNSEILLGNGVSALPSVRTAISKASNAGSILKDTPFKSEYDTDDDDDESEHSENLAGLNTIFGRLGSIAAAGRTTDRDE